MPRPRMRRGILLGNTRYALGFFVALCRCRGISSAAWQTFFCGRLIPYANAVPHDFPWQRHGKCEAPFGNSRRAPKDRAARFASAEIRFCVVRGPEVEAAVR